MEKPRSSSRLVSQWQLGVTIVLPFHAKAAVKQGANREEVMEALGMAVYMGAGPSVMYATHALDAFTQFENENTLVPA